MTKPQCYRSLGDKNSFGIFLRFYFYFFIFGKDFGHVIYVNEYLWHSRRTQLTDKLLKRERLEDLPE